MSNIDLDDPVYLVVANAEGQYSIWPAFKPLPAGWQATGFQGLKKDCLDHIAKVWTDTRPLSLQARQPR